MDQFEIVYLSFFHQRDGSLLIGVETERRGGGGWVGLNSSNSWLMGICLRIRWHFHDYIDYYGVGFSIDLLEWGAYFRDFGDKKILEIKDLKMGR